MTTLREFIVAGSSLPASSTIRELINNPAVGEGGGTVTVSGVHEMNKQNTQREGDLLSSVKTATRIIQTKQANKNITRTANLELIKEGNRVCPL